MELKSERGRLTRQQAEWLNDLRNAGVEAYIWRPCDLSAATQILRSLA